MKRLNLAAANPARAIPSEVNPYRGEDTEVDLGSVISSLSRGKWTILFFIVAALSAGSFYTMRVAVPMYTAISSLTLEVRAQNIADLQNVISGVSTDQAALNTEIDIMQSRPLLRKLMEQHDLTTDPEFNPWIRKPSTFSVSAVKSLIFGNSANEGDVQLPPEDVLKRAAVDNLSNAVSVTGRRNTYNFDISVTTQNPDKSATLANSLAEIYIKNQINNKFSATEYAIDWLSEKVNEVEVEYNSLEDQIAEINSTTEFRGEDGLLALSSLLKENRDRLILLEEDLRKQEDRQNNALEKLESQDFDAVVMIFDDPMLRRFLEPAKVGEKPAVVAFSDRLAALISEAEGLAGRNQAQINSFRSANNELAENISIQNRDFSIIKDLTREIESVRIVYETLLARLKETSLQVGLQRADSRILSQAAYGFLVKPRKNRIAAASILLGAIIGSALVLLRHMTSTNYRSPDQLEHDFDIAVLGAIPMIPVRKRKELVAYIRNKPTSAGAEAIRNIRTSILMTDNNTPPQTILTTSSVPAEGKTTFSVLLALNLVSLSRRVLIVEGDLRRITFKNYFPESYTKGLGEALAGEDMDGLIYHDPTSGLDVLSAGSNKENPADLFSSGRFLEILDILKSRYDHIIIDTPPVLVVPDTRIICRFVDAIVYSVKWDSTGRGQVANGVRQLTSIGLKISGLIITQVNEKQNAKYGYGYNYGSYSGKNTYYEE